MNNMSYSEYMRTVLGYTPYSMQDNLCCTNDYYITQDTSNCMNDSDLEDLYPDVYKRINPLVCKQCNTNTMPITQEILEQMVDNVYNSIEVDLKIETNTKLQVNASSGVRQQENRTRQSNNTLRDLIKILILKELIDRGRFPGRPPFPPRPPMPGPGPRPPFPGGPGGGPRPPFPPQGPRPRDF